MSAGTPGRSQAELDEIFEQFAIPGQLLEAAPYGSGYINDTYLGRYQLVGSQTGAEALYIHQRINHQVFKQPEKLMENLERVTIYARQQIIAAGGDPQRETLNVVPTHSGASFIRTAAGDYWRTFLFIPGTTTYEILASPELAYSPAYAFGHFQKLLAGLPGERLHETIPDFHHTRKRFDAFIQAVQADSAGRCAECRAEIDFILQREADAGRVVDLLASGQLPERVTHNDTKLNNVLIDEKTGRGICVIDLDTVMPGSLLYDFGDLIRMGTATAAEDETDLTRVRLDLQLFTWLARGYLDAVRDILTEKEWELLTFGGRLITYEQAIRFLGDYLRGDVYYKIRYPKHNLDRARNQIKMVQEMESLKGEMEGIIAALR
jgi:hypothetical protein